MKRDLDSGCGTPGMASARAVLLGPLARTRPLSVANALVQGTTYVAPVALLGVAIWWLSGVVSGRLATSRASSPFTSREWCRSR